LVIIKMKPLETRVASEFIGTTFLLAAVVGSGIMGERLAGGNVAIALLANTIATGAALVVLILTFGPISGAHFNPVVTLADSLEGGISWVETLPYILAQIFGGISGAIIARSFFTAFSPLLTGGAFVAQMARKQPPLIRMTRFQLAPKSCTASPHPFMFQYPASHTQPASIPLGFV
jgi:glycerol uptake facilitator-like aquaporin